MNGGQAPDQTYLEVVGLWYTVRMNVRIIRAPITKKELDELAGAFHRTLVKGVADIERKIVALGGEWHMDANTALIADGSEQKNLWGFNVYPGEKGDKAIEYVSLINIRPAQGNKTMELADEHLRTATRDIVRMFVPNLAL